MLPSPKRPPRQHDDVIRTGDYQVVRSAPTPRPAAGSPSSRPRPPLPSVDDDEATQLFSGSVRSMVAPKVPSAAPPASLQGLVGATRGKIPSQEFTNLRGAVAPRMDAEDRTVLRPLASLTPARHDSSPPARTPSRPPPAMPSVRPAAGAPATHPVATLTPPPMPRLNAPGGSDVRPAESSDPSINPPASVITARTPVLRVRSSGPFAAGLIALGAVVGLLIAIVARGDADSIIDATASLVDSPHAAPARAGAAAAQAAVLPNFVEVARPKPAAPSESVAAVAEPTVSAPVVVNPAPAPAKAAMLVEPAPAPVRAARPAYAYARPAPRPAPAAPAPEKPSTSSGWLANVTPAGAGAPIARPSRAGKGAGEFEGAAAADALAKAQLEASLR